MNIIFSLILTLFLFGCNSDGNGDGYSDDGVSYTHNELALMFVNNINLSDDFSFVLVKADTQQGNYIVVKDTVTGSFEAISISGYSPVENAEDYYYNNIGNVYYNLERTPGYWENIVNEVITGYDDAGEPIYGTVVYPVWHETLYTDVNTNIVFEKIEGTPKDLAKVAALKEVILLEKRAQGLSKKFGLSLSRSKEISRLSAHWDKASIKSMTSAELDQFGNELLGFSISEGVNAYQNLIDGNETNLDSLISKAAEKNSISPEHAKKLFTKIFLK